MASDDRTERVTIRVSPAEMKMLHDLAKASGLSSADIVRLLIRQEHASKFPPKKR